MKGQSTSDLSWWQTWRPAIAVGLMFATNGAIIAALLPWYPTIKAEWGLNDAQFGLMVAAMAAGSLVSSVLPSLIERRVGARRTVVSGTVALALILILAGHAQSAWMLGILLFFYGMCDAIVDVSQNIAGVAVQQAMGRSIISSVHACWSLGGVIGGLLSTAAAQAGLDMALCFLVCAVLSVAIIALAATWVGPIPQSQVNESEDATTTSGGRVFVVIWRALPVACVAGAGVVVEEVGSNWAPLAAVDLAGVSLTSAGIAYTVVLAAQTIGRFTGDALINRHGRVRVARVGGVLIAVGGLCVMSATSSPVLYVGFALAGYGCATLVPSAYAAAAGIRGLHPSEGVTAVSWLMRLVMLVLSPAIGALSTATDLRWALGVLLLSGVIVALAAGALGATQPRVTSQDTPRPAAE